MGEHDHEWQYIRAAATLPGIGHEVRDDGGSCVKAEHNHRHAFFRRRLEMIQASHTRKHV